MSAFRRLLFLLFLLPAALPAAWPPASTGLHPDPAIRFGTLDNGLRYAVKSHPEPRGRISLRMVVLAGSLHETESERGLAHFVEHMAFNGTRLYPKETLVGVLRRNGFAFGADVSAFTHPTHTIYGLETSTTSEARLEEGFTVLREFADGQTFDPDEIERERGVIHSERRARDNWQARAGEALTGFLYPGSLIARRHPIGEAEIVTQATAEDLRRFYHTWYRPDNLLLIAVGDAPTEQMEALIAEKFASMRAPDTSLPPAPDLSPLGNPDTLAAALHHTHDARAVTIQLKSVVPGPGGPETLASRQASLRRELVIDMLRERFGQLRSARAAEFGEAAAYSISSGQHYTQTGLALSTATANWSQAVEALAIEWRRIEEQGFATHEIAEAIQRMQRRFEYAVAAAHTEPSAQIVERLALIFVQEQIPSTWAQVADLVETIAPAFDETAALAEFRNLWLPGAPRLFLLGNLLLDDAPAQLIAAWESGLRQPLPSPPRPTLGHLDYAAAPRPGKIRHRRHIEDLDIHTIEFANGIRLNLKTTPFSRNLVHFRARVGSGLRNLPRDRAALRLIASPYLMEAGVGRHRGDELRRYMAQRNLSLDFGFEEEAMIFAGGADTRGLPDLLLLLQAFLQDPAWREQDYQTALNHIPLIYGETEHEPAAALGAMSARVMSRDDPRFALPSMRALEELSFPRLTSWLGREIKDSPVELGLIGDFDLETAITLAARTLGALPRRPVRKAPARPTGVIPFHGTPGRWQVEVQTDIPRASVRVQWLVRGCGDVHTLRRLETLATVLEHRIEKEIRENQGATYDPAATVWNGETLRDDGYLMISLTAPPADALMLARRITELADELARDGLTQADLEAARQPVLAGNDARLRDNGYWLYYVLQSAQEQPARLEWPRSRERDYLAMTVDELNTLARRYLAHTSAQSFVAVPQ